MKAFAALSLRNPSWVERQGGVDLLTHLRGAADRAEYRRTGIARAFDRFLAAERNGEPEPSTGGLGLLVMQRALLAAEDLGGVLHAFREKDPWTELRATTIARIDEAFEWAVVQPVEALPKVFLIADRNTLEEEGLGEGDIEILMRLHERTIQRWDRMLETSGSLWLSIRDVAKATMHGFPIWAGDFVFTPPGAGQLSEGLPDSPYGRCALLVTSTEHKTGSSTEVRTHRSPVRLDQEAVARYAREGKVAARLYAEICDAHAQSRMLGYAAGIPFLLARNVSASDRERLAELSQERRE